MTQYILKSALVTQIKERIETYKKGYANGDDRRADALEVLLHDIDTFEVKEMDLEKELDSMITPELKLHKALPSLFDVAKHFFELGLLNTITEEDCKLIWNIGDEIPYMPEEEFFKELLRKYKAQKGEV